MTQVHLYDMNTMCDADNYIMRDIVFQWSIWQGLWLRL